MSHSDRPHHGNDKKRTQKIKHPLLDVNGRMVYQDKHWQPLSELDPMNIEELTPGKSAATKMVEAHECDGVLHLSGSFMTKHKEEIMSIIRHMSENAKQEDITNEVVDIEEVAADKATVYTVKNQLAVRIGKKVHESYKGGELKIHWSKDDMPVEVWWHKDLD